MGHSLLSPSGGDRWMKCPGSLVMEFGKPESTSTYSEEGTMGHALSAYCLINKVDAQRAPSPFNYEDHGVLKIEPIPEDMPTEIQKYLDYVRELGKHGEVLVEQRLDHGRVLGFEGQFGTSDTVVLMPDELIIVDLKYGKGIKVDAKDNAQLLLYAVGAYDAFSALNDFKRVRVVIHQPRLNWVSEWVYTIAELEQFTKHATERAQHAMAVFKEKPEAVVHHLRPGVDQCRFCKAKGSCLKRAEDLVNTVAGKTELDVTKITPPLQVLPVGGHLNSATLGILMFCVDEIERWCEDIRGEVASRLHRGEAVAGYKLVEGKQGNRQWEDEAQAEIIMKSMRLKLDEMYEYKIISPTAADKLLKKDNPKKWARLESLITRKKGQAAVVPESDERTALVINPADDFDDVSEGELI